MTHLATLIHDDIVDKSLTRRGNPTVNALWGNEIAILLGDYYFAKTAGRESTLASYYILCPTQVIQQQVVALQYVS